MSFAKSFHRPDLGYLLLRILVGGLMFNHGLQNLIAGVETWEMLGSVMANFGITVYPSLFGLVCVVIQTFGGLFFLLGLFFRPVCMLLTLVMLLAVCFHLMSGHEFPQAELAAVFTILFTAFTFMGPGRYSVDK
ncbi:MAG TPA: DoxX family membrane protein [Opitutales bacterium]|nr:DoxX family membrane protein [Opitutales bacterium]